jgi:dTDP-4-dehydrorhamnose 3,5-epimerase-like enzyme
MSFIQHPTAIVENATIGDGSVIGPYAVIRGANLGANCTVGSHASVEGAIQIGDLVEIGICAVVLPEVSIGERAVVEAGSVVTRNVPATAVVTGNPARIVRYVETITHPAVIRPADTRAAVVPTSVRGVTLHHLPLIEDLRGNLSFGEVEHHVPFPIKRYFLTFDVLNEEVRGEHAHRTLHQFLICVHGRLHILADDGRRREEFLLDRPTVAVHLPPMVWGVQYRFSPNAVLLVLCSDLYDPEDYIRDYSDFLRLVADNW